MFANNKMLLDIVVWFVNLIRGIDLGVRITLSVVFFVLALFSLMKSIKKVKEKGIRAWYVFLCVLCSLISLMFVSL